MASGIAAKKGRALGVAFADYMMTLTDMFVTNDGMQQYLFHNNRNGTFTERALDAGAALSKIAGNCPAWGCLSGLR